MIAALKQHAKIVLKARCPKIIKIKISNVLFAIKVSIKFRKHLILKLKKHWKIIIHLYNYIVTPMLNLKLNSTARKMFLSSVRNAHLWVIATIVKTVSRYLRIISIIT